MGLSRSQPTRPDSICILPGRRTITRAILARVYKKVLRFAVQSTSSATDAPPCAMAAGSALELGRSRSNCTAFVRDVGAPASINPASVCARQGFGLAIPVLYAGFCKGEAAAGFGIIVGCPAMCENGVVAKSQNLQAPTFNLPSCQP